MLPRLRKRGTGLAAGAPSSSGRSSEVAADGGDQFAVAGVAGELPEERARAALRLHVAHLPGDRRRGVVAPPVAAAVRVRRSTDGPGGRAAGLEDLVVLDAG